MSALVPPYIEALVPYQPGKPVSEVEREFGLTDVLKLASNESPYPSAPAIEAAKRALEAVHVYPDGAGHDLRTALAAHFAVWIDEVIIGNGSNELIDIILRTFASPSEHVVHATPSFDCYALGCQMEGLERTAVPLLSGYRYDIDGLLAAVRPDTRLLFVATPNNPTGTYIPKRDLERLLASLPSHVIPVLDEAYVEFADAEDFVTGLAMRALHPNIIVLRTFSKAYGLAGLRVGFGIGPAELIGYAQRVRAPFNVNAIGQAAAVAALHDEAHVAAYVALNREERARVYEGMTALGVSPVPSQTNFVMVDVGRPAQPVYRAMLEAGVIVRPLGGALGSCLRVTVGTPSQNTRMLAALERALRV